MRLDETRLMVGDKLNITNTSKTLGVITSTGRVTEINGRFSLGEKATQTYKTLVTLRAALLRLHSRGWTFEIIDEEEY